MGEIKQGYKQTEFGLIPEDWKLCTFKDVLSTFSSGATPYRGIPEYYKGEIRWISSGELNYDTINETIEHISELAVKNTNLKTHSPGTFLMAVTGLEAEGTRGRCAIVGLPSTTNQSCLAINSTVRMTTEYLFWFYRQWSEYLAFKYCQGTKQQSYTAALVKELPICCPKETTEQSAIATALSDVDALIAALEKKITKKQQIKQGAMQQLLTGNKRLAGFSGEWVETRLGSGLKFQTGNPFSSIFFNKDNFGVRLIKNRDLKSDDQVVFYSGLYTNDFIVNNGDVLIGMDGDFLPCIWEKGMALLNQRVGRILITSDWNAIFLYYYLYNPLKEKQEGTGATTVKHLSHKDIENMELPLPPTEVEQTAIAQILTDMDDEICQLKADRNKYEQIKAGMMQQLLTGKIRLFY